MARGNESPPNVGHADSIGSHDNDTKPPEKKKTKRPASEYRPACWRNGCFRRGPRKILGDLIWVLMGAGADIVPVDRHCVQTTAVEGMAVSWKAKVDGDNEA